MRDDAPGHLQLCSSQIALLICLDQSSLHFFVRSRGNNDCNPKRNPPRINRLEQDVFTMFQELHDSVCKTYFHAKLLRNLLSFVAFVEQDADFVEKGAIGRWPPGDILNLCLAKTPSGREIE